MTAVAVFVGAVAAAAVGVGLALGLSGHPLAGLVVVLLGGAAWEWGAP